MHRGRVGAFTVSAVAVFGAAVPPAAPPSSPPPSSPPPAASAFGELLDQVPAASLDEESALLTYVDMNLVWSRLGLADATSEERIARLGELSAPDTYVILPRLFASGASLDATIAEVGFSIANIEREVAVDNPPASIRIDEVSVPAADVDAAVRSDPTWSDRVTDVTEGSVTFFDWNGAAGPAADPQRVTPMRPDGIGGQLLITPSDDGGSTIVRTNEVDVMRSIIATSSPVQTGASVPAPSGAPAATGETGSSAANATVAGDPRFAPLIAAVDPEGGTVEVVQALVTTLTTSYDDAVAATAATSGSSATAATSGSSATAATSGSSATAATSGSSATPASTPDAPPAVIPAYAALLAAEVTDGTTTAFEILLNYGTADAATANAPVVTTYLATATTPSGASVAELFPAATATAEGSLVRITVPGAGHARTLVTGLLTRDVLLTG